MPPTVIANEQIVDAHRRGRQYLEVRSGDIITALARETAEQLNIQLLDHPIETPSQYRPDAATEMRRILYRRNPAWKAPTRRRNPNPDRIERLAIVGVGGVGGNIAHLATNHDLAEQIVLIDVLPGLAASTALDLDHSRGSTRTSVQVTGGESLDLLTDAQIIVVTAGQARTPGMSRSDLIEVNSRIIRSVGTAIADLAPQSIVIVVSNPLDEMTYLMLQTTGFPRERVLGMAGTLDSARFRNALAQAAGVSAADVEAVTLGSHGDEMVPIVSKASIRERPLADFLTEEQIEACRDQTVSAGAAVVALRKRGSATIAPAHATVELIDYIRGAHAGAVPVSVLLKGEYGIEDTVVGVPCELGKSGVLNIVEMQLTEAEQKALQDASNAVKARLEAQL